MSITAYTKGGKRAYRAEFEYQGRRFTKAGFLTLDAARLWTATEKKRLKKDSATPHLPNLKKLMYSDACAAYLTDSRARHQPGTFTEKSRHLTEFVEFVGYDVPVEDISEAQSEAFISFIQSTTTNKTANRYLRTLKAFWNWTSRRHSIGSSPFIIIQPYPEDSPHRYIPPTEDVIAVLGAARQWERDFLNVLLKTGARPGEIRALQWNDVDFSRATITLWTRKRKSGQSEPRTMNMSAQLTEVLKRRFQERASETWVFINEVTGKPFTRQSRPVKYLMERLCKAASTDERPIKPFTFYAFRHFVATRLRDSGKANKYEIQHILGHKRSDTTDRYLRELAPDLQDAVAALDDVIDINALPEDRPKAAKVIKISRG